MRRFRIAIVDRFVAAATVAGSLLACATGCHGGPQAVHPDATPSPHEPTVLALSEDRFADATHELLRDGKPSPERTALVGAVVRKQLQHAAQLFARGEDVRGTEAVVGAFLLLGGSDGTAIRLDATSLPALDGALRRFSSRGEEGRAHALLALQRSLVRPGSEAARAIAQHLDALTRWQSDTRRGGPMQVLSTEQKELVARALFEPSDANVAAAVKAVEHWIDRAIEINVAFQETRQMPEREEAIEAFRALQTGAYVMATLYLRQGRAGDALKALEATSASRVTRPAFFAKLRAAAEAGHAEDWRHLARELGQVGSDADAEEGPLPPDVLDAALWGVSVEAYRRDPSSLAVAHLVASELSEHEMPEAAPLVLADALGREPIAPALSGALDLVADALGDETDNDSVAAARRVFEASKRLFELADSPRYEGQLQTTAASLRQRMAALELRAGNPARARELMIAALRAEPTAWGLNSLATLERQLGDVQGAEATAERAFHLQGVGLPDLDAANARLLTFELFRDAGLIDRAKGALDDALRIALDVRRMAGMSEAAVRAETMLARIFDGYGETERANRAMARALELADQHRALLPQTMLAAIARASVEQNVASARAALGLGQKADIDHDSLVYGALWVGALERLVGETSDGKVDRVLADAVNGDSWTTRLARWARGSMTDEELVKSARTHSDAVEAEFYLTLRMRSGRSPQALERLKSLAHNPLVDLFEVRLARDLVAPRLHLALPTDAKLP